MVSVLDKLDLVALDIHRQVPPLQSELTAVTSQQMSAWAWAAPGAVMVAEQGLEIVNEIEADPRVPLQNAEPVSVMQAPKPPRIG